MDVRGIRCDVVSDAAFSGVVRGTVRYAGDVVGLASLVSASPCERVNASTAVRAALLSDQDFLKQLTENQDFSDWCQQRIWPAELERLLKPMREANAEDLPDFAPALQNIAFRQSFQEPSLQTISWPKINFPDARP